MIPGCCQTCFVQRIAGHGGRQRRVATAGTRPLPMTGQTQVWLWPDKNFRPAPRTPPELGRQAGRQAAGSRQQAARRNSRARRSVCRGGQACCFRAAAAAAAAEAAKVQRIKAGKRLRGNCLSERDGESESAQPPFPPARSGRPGCWAGRERGWLSATASRSTRRFVAEGFLACVRCDRLIRPRSKRALARQSKTWPQENWQEQGVTSSAPGTAQSPTSDAQRPLPPAKSILLVSALFSLFLFLASKDAPLLPALWSPPVHHSTAGRRLAHLDALSSDYPPLPSASSSSSSSPLHFQALHSNSTTPCQE